MTSSSNPHRRLLAEIFADAEDHGLGTWTPVFHARTEKIEQVRAFVASRSALLADKRLTLADVTPATPADDDEDNLVLYRAVLEASASLLIPGASVTHEAMGVAAWMQLSDRQRRDMLPSLLGCYVGRILDEERERTHQEIADSPGIDTLLHPDDVCSAWDAALAHSDGLPVAGYEAVVDRGVLQRLLEEVDLLRRRSTPAPDSV